MILYVSQQLGHSSAAFTLSTYAHLIQQGRKLDKEETLRRLSEAARCEHAPRGDPKIAYGGEQMPCLNGDSFAIYPRWRLRSADLSRLATAKSLQKARCFTPLC